MQAIREIHTVKNGKVNLTLPEMFWDTEVEIIVLAKTQKTNAKTSEDDPLYGCLSQYANSEKREQETGAWERATGDNKN